LSHHHFLEEARKLGDNKTLHTTLDENQFETELSMDRKYHHPKGEDGA
jgi:glycerol-3-phosphate cytidylyltransferase-like family protein